MIAQYSKSQRKINCSDIHFLLFLTIFFGQYLNNLKQFNHFASDYTDRVLTGNGCSFLVMNSLITILPLVYYLGINII
jgi:hypothetical protein